MTDKKNLNQPNNDEIDILKLLNVLWTKKIVLITFFIVSSIVSVVYALSIPNQYQSSTLIIAADDSSMDNAFSQYGSLASLAGVSLPETRNNNNAVIGMEIIKSKQFVQNFIDRRNILVPLMAADGWDLNNNELIYDQDLYDFKTKTWLRKPTPLKTAEPTLQEAYAHWMKNIFSISKDLKSGVIYITIKHYSPYIAEQWSSWLVEDLNKFMLDTDVAQADRSIDYLNQEVIKTSSDELKSLFYSLIQSNTETKMLAYSRENYVFRVIDPPQVPINKISPNRPYICIIGSFLGTVIGILYILILNYFSNRKYNY